MCEERLFLFCAQLLAERLAMQFAAGFSEFSLLRQQLYHSTNGLGMHHLEARVGGAC